MSKDRPINRLKRIWGKAGLDQIPTPADIKGTMRKPDETVSTVRAKSLRTARLDLRVTPDEKKRLELMAVREGVSLNGLFARMLDLYEREHGRVEIASRTQSVAD